MLVIRLLVFFLFCFFTVRPSRGQKAGIFLLPQSSIAVNVSSFAGKRSKYKKSPLQPCKTSFDSHLLSEEAGKCELWMKKLTVR